MFSLSLGMFPFILLLWCGSAVSATIPSSGCTLLSPAPAKKICGETGDNPIYVQDPIFAQQTLSSLTECQDLCLRRADSGDASCVNFSYDSSASLCTITPEVLKRISKSATSDVIFYERACFACPQPCSQQTLGQDLLDNSGFDISPKLLGPWFASGGNTSAERGGDIQGIDNNKKGSKPSYFCTAGKSDKCSIRQSFSSCPTTVYKWSYDYQAVDKKFDTFFATAHYGGNNTHSLRYPDNSPATLKWHTYTDVFQVQNDVISAAMIFDLQPGHSAKGKGPKTFQAKDIKIEPTNFIVGPEPGALNTLPAGGFELGTLAPWVKTKKDEDLSIVSPGIMKEFALKWSFKGGQSKPSFGIMQDLTTVKRMVTVPGTPYLFNLDHTNDLPMGMGIQPLIFTKFELFTGDNSSVINSHNTYSNLHEGNQATIRIPFMGQVNQFFTRITITILSEVPVGNHTMIVDDISFKPLARASSSTL